MCRYAIDPTAIGAKIKELRNLKGLTVAQVCDYVGIYSEQAVYKWQRGESMPTLDNLVTLCDLFEVTLDELLIKRRIGDEYER
jgi:transcriptional regulator with XRE-family HTH domain